MLVELDDVIQWIESNAHKYVEEDRTAPFPVKLCGYYTNQMLDDLKRALEEK